MTTTELGRRAETAAANFLAGKGCVVIDRNWRTKVCEVDIIASRDQVVYFCEVKYRSHSRQGDGLDYITPAKLRRMRFAAELWVHVHAWRGEYELCAIAVSGPAFRISGVAKGL